VSAGRRATGGRRSRARAYAAAAWIAARHAWASRFEIVGRAAFLALLLWVFSRLWRAVPVGRGADARSLLWYLAITEWVLLSVPFVHLDLERDVRSGDLAYLLPRPVSYVGVRVAESLGTLAVRLATLGVVGGALATALSGGLPPDPRGLLLVVPMGALAGVFGVLAQAGIGLLAVWLQDVSPVYWVWQKAAFVLGGLILPLHLYPGWLAATARWTPFAAFLHGPGRLAFGLDAPAAIETAAMLVGWTALAAWGLHAVHRAALRVLDVNGG
jgi:ABC-2 type transport system permease protein